MSQVAGSPDLTFLVSLHLFEVESISLGVFHPVPMLPLTLDCLACSSTFQSAVSTVLEVLFWISSYLMMQYSNVVLGWNASNVSVILCLSFFFSSGPFWRDEQADTLSIATACCSATRWTFCATRSWRCPKTFTNASAWPKRPPTSRSAPCWPRSGRKPATLFKWQKKRTTKKLRCSVKESSEGTWVRSWRQARSRGWLRLTWFCSRGPSGGGHHHVSPTVVC